MDDCLLLDAGSGGRASQRLIAQCFMRHFANPLLERMDDAALLTDISGPLAMSTDSYTVAAVFCRALPGFFYARLSGMTAGLSGFSGRTGRHVFFQRGCGMRAGSRRATSLARLR